MSLQMLAESDRLGIFAAAAPVGGPAAFLTGLSRGALLVLWTTLALILGLLLRHRRLAVAHALGCGTMRR
jgi:hypothetical protein